MVYEYEDGCPICNHKAPDMCCFNCGEYVAMFNYDFNKWEKHEKKVKNHDRLLTVDTTLQEAGGTVLRIRKSRGLLTFNEIQDYIAYNSDYQGKYVIIFDSKADVGKHCGKYTDEVLAYQYYGKNCPVCGRISMPTVCPKCGNPSNEFLG